MLPRAALAFLLALTACTTATDPTTPVTSAGLFVPPFLPDVGTAVDATVTRVHDGDSMDVLIDGQPDEVRLVGINAPESDECLGDAAREAMIEAVADKEVALFGTDRDQFGRLLAFVEVGGSPVGWLAVRSGLALAITVDHPRLAAYAEAEDDAYIDQIGMWAIDACGPPTAEIVGITEIDWDPPGRDEDNLNGEFVRLETDEDPFDIGGWALRDESTRWRFDFPQGFRLAGELTIYTGCGDDGTHELYWCATGPVWNNLGDSVLLLDRSGNVVARIAYGAKQDR